MRSPFPIGLIAATGFCLAAFFYRNDPTGFLLTVGFLPLTSLVLFFFWNYRYKEPIAALISAWIFLVSVAALEPLVFHRAPSLVDSIFIICLLWLVVRDVAFKQKSVITVVLAAALSTVHAFVTRFAHINVDLIGIVVVAVAPVAIRKVTQLHADVLSPVKIVSARTAQVIGSFFLVLLCAVIGFAAINFSVFSILPEEYSLKDPNSAFTGFQQSATTTLLVFLFESLASTFNQTYTQIKPVGRLALLLGFTQALVTWTIFSVYLKFLLTEPKTKPPDAN